MTFGSLRCRLSQSVETSQRLASFSSAIQRSRESGKRYPHAAVLLALFLDLRHADGADLTGAPHMRATTGLQVESDNLDQPHLAGADRRFHRHGFDKAWIGFEFLVRDPARAHLRVRLDHLVYFGGDVVLVESGFRNIEVEP